MKRDWREEREREWGREEKGAGKYGLRKKTRRGEKGRGKKWTR